MASWIVNGALEKCNNCNIITIIEYNAILP